LKQQPVLQCSRQKFPSEEMLKRPLERPKWSRFRICKEFQANLRYSTDETHVLVLPFSPPLFTVYTVLHDAKLFFYGKIIRKLVGNPWRSCMTFRVKSFWPCLNLRIRINCRKDLTMLVAWNGFQTVIL
jgi:hypothetical protein